MYTVIVHNYKRAYKYYEKSSLDLGRSDHASTRYVFSEDNRVKVIKMGLNNAHWIHFETAFDSVYRSSLLSILTDYGFQDKSNNILKDIYTYI